MRPARTRTAAVLGLIATGALIVVGTGATAKKKRSFPRGPYPSLGACPAFPASAAAPGTPAAADQTAWNQDISAAPLDPSSAGYIAYIQAHGGDNLHPDFGSPREYGFPYAVVGRRQKPVKVRFTAYGDESTHGKYRIPLAAPVEGGRSSDGDRHVLTWDRKRCKLHELYRAFPRKKPRPRWLAESGVIWNLRSSALRTPGHTSADAAGLPVFPGLVRFDEAAAGVIGHAIRVTFSSTQNAYVNPATHCASNVTDPNAPPMGLRLRLNAGYDTSGITGPARAIADALKRFGMIVADNGSNWFISGTSDRRWNDDNLNQLKDIPGTAFEVVQSVAGVHPC